MGNRIKLLKDKENLLKKFWDWLQHKKETINSFTTFINILVTVALIVVTVVLINGTNLSIEANKEIAEITNLSIEANKEIAEITIYLEKQKKIENMRFDLALAMNLKFELMMNEVALKDYLSTLEKMKIINKTKLETISISELDNIDTKSDFGTAEIRLVSKVYLLELKLLNEHLLRVDRPQGLAKNNSIDKVIYISDNLINGKNIMNISEFIILLDDYKKNLSDKINLLESAQIEELIKR